MSLNFPWRALELLLTIPLNNELRCFNSSLSWTQVWAHKQYLAYIWIWTIRTMQDIERWELRDEDQTQTPGHVSRFESLLYFPAFTQKDFHYPQRIFHKGTSTKELQIITLEYRTPTLTPLHKRQHKAKKRLQLGDPMITNNTWWSQRIINNSSHKQDPKG